MKKLKYILCALLLLSTQQVFSAEAEFIVDGAKLKEVDHLLVGQTIEVVVKSKKKNVLVSGSLGKSKSKLQKFSSVTLSHKVSMTDLVRGYVDLMVFFQEKEGGSAVDSFVRNIKVTTPNAIKIEANLTDQQRVDRFLEGFPEEVDNSSRGKVKEKDESSTRVPAARRSGRGK
jgi:hypothetical protein